MRIHIKYLIILVCGCLLPVFAGAQDLNSDINGLHGVLDHLYDELMPMCSQLIAVARGIAGFAALWYIASRVWKHLSNAEPIDFYPLFRPFVIGFAIAIFPSVLSMINAVMKPTVTATASMVNGSNEAVATLLIQKEQMVKASKAWQMYVGESGIGDRDKWYKYTHDDQSNAEEGLFEGLGNDIKFAMEKASYNMRNSIKEWLSEILQLLFEAASLCIDTIRTFQLVVLSILGPLVFGLSVFDGFQHTLKTWLARYINVFLWLPVANLFGAIIGKIQEKMLAIDITQVQQSGDTFFSSTDAAYLIFLCIGIVGYFTVPSIANHIMNAGGGSAMVQKVNNIFHTATTNTVQGAMSATTTTGNTLGNIASSIAGGITSSGSLNNNSSGSGGSNYMRDKLSGNS
jgi:conjugative transposon TraJ protein